MRDQISCRAQLASIRTGERRVGGVQGVLRGNHHGEQAAPEGLGRDLENQVVAHDRMPFGVQVLHRVGQGENRGAEQ